MDAAGVISLNEDSVIGDLGTAANVKEYVDAKDDALAQSIIAEAAAREAGDTALGARIDALTEASENADTALAAQLADSIDAVNDQRAASDSALQLQISSNLNGINANADSIADVDNKVVLLSDQSASGDEAVYESVVGMLQDSVTALESADGVQDGRLDALENSTDLQDSVTALEAADAAEAAARAAADDSIVGLLGDSVTALEAADAAEAAARIAGDDSIVGLLGDSVTALEAADAAEAAARIAGDDSIVGLLGDSVTALQDKTLLLENLGIISATGADDTAVDGLESHDIYYNTNSESYRVKLYDGGVNAYVDAATAKADGVIVGQIYYNTTVGALMTIMS